MGVKDALAEKTGNKGEVTDSCVCTLEGKERRIWLRSDE